ncbi:MAG: hypothetical protein ACI8VY_000749 [Cellvibrionaceae bacterium]|jgi:hypothetical protein
MKTVYLNGQYMPMQEAKVSPMDRGFLFGDGSMKLSLLIWVRPLVLTCILLA